MTRIAEAFAAFLASRRVAGKGSVSPEAVAYGRGHGVEVVDGGCPCMFGATRDAGHRLMRPFLTAAGAVPRRV